MSVLCQKYLYHYPSNVEVTLQSFPFYRDNCRAQIDVLFYSGLSWFFLFFCHLIGAFELRSLEIYCKIKLDQTVGIHSNNLDCKGLIKILPGVSIGFCSIQCMSNYDSMLFTCKLSMQRNLPLPTVRQTAACNLQSDFTNNFGFSFSGNALQRAISCNVTESYRYLGRRVCLHFLLVLKKEMVKIFRNFGSPVPGYVTR